MEIEIETSYVLHQTKNQHWQHLHILTERQLRTCSRTRGRHAALVSGQDLHHLTVQRITTVFQLMGEGLLDSLVGEVRCQRDLVSGSKDLRQAGSRRDSGGNDTDTSLAITSGVEHGSLEYDEWSCDGLLDLNLDDVSLILRDGGHSQKIGGTNEEVAMERGHSETSRSTDTHDSFQHDRHSQHTAELVSELYGVFRTRGIERRVEVSLTGRIVGEAR